jgi:hypothetical protein
MPARFRQSGLCFFCHRLAEESLKCSPQRADEHALPQRGAVATHVAQRRRFAVASTQCTPSRI